jgi:cytoskeletal protein CcmA (bactofilin family)
VADKQRANDDLSLVGAGTLIEGKIKTEGSIRVDGTLVGEIVAKVNAAIGLTGAVEGGVMAKNVTIAGKVKGTVTASDKLTLEGKSITRGDIRASKLIVDEGAMFDGQCAMTSQSGSTKEGSPQK